jgi:integrase
MATIRRRGRSWQAQVRRHGHPPITKSFQQKSDAELWARQLEVDLERGDAGIFVRKQASTPLSDLLFRYQKEITPRKRGSDAENYRLKTLLQHEIARTPVHKLTASAVARYRDQRLLVVSSSSVRRELVILRHCLEVARKEWDAPLKENPVHSIQVPTDGKARERRLDEDELAALLEAADRCRNPYVKPVVQFALETGMRRGEILGLVWANIDLKARTAAIHQTKNGHARTVPLSVAAVAILKAFEPRRGLVFPISANALRLSWDRMKERAQLRDLRFHDLRHEAVSRFFELGLSVPEVALISGHRDPRMLFRYTHPKPKDIAKKLV